MSTDDISRTALHPEHRRFEKLKAHVDGLTAELRILIVQRSLSPPGGGNAVAAWMVHALAGRHDLPHSRDGRNPSGR